MMEDGIAGVADRASIRWWSWKQKSMAQNGVCRGVHLSATLVLLFASSKFAKITEAVEFDPSRCNMEPSVIP